MCNYEIYSVSFSSVTGQLSTRGLYAHESLNLVNFIVILLVSNGFNGKKIIQWLLILATALQSL